MSLEEEVVFLNVNDVELLKAGRVEVVREIAPDVGVEELLLLGNTLSILTLPFEVLPLADPLESLLLLTDVGIPLVRVVFCFVVPSAATVTGAGGPITSDSGPRSSWLDKVELLSALKASLA